MTDPIKVAAGAYLDRLKAHFSDGGTKEDMPAPPSPEVADFLSNMATELLFKVAEVMREKGIPLPPEDQW